ncbi:MAG: class I SAM-dependent RNA methyltransferase [Candidatus Nanopelagicales bacterium]
MIATVEVLRYAAGGNCVARHDGRVLFIRGVIPGEKVEVEIEDFNSSKRYSMAKLLNIIEPSPLRIEPACKYYGICGGCDWQHIDLAEQKRMHWFVLSDQLSRIGKLQVEPKPVLTVADESGFGYRTRMRFAVSDSGKLAMRQIRSNDLVEIDSCLIASEKIDEVTKLNWPPSTEVIITQGADEVLVLTERIGAPEITYRNKFGEWRAPAGEFWQVHQMAPETLISQVLNVLQPSPGDVIADLYSGVGLFAQPIAKKVTDAGSVVAVEFDQPAHLSAIKNLSLFPWATAINSDVAQYLKSASGFNKAVVDPPRAGLNKSVITSLSNMVSLQKLCYVSCDAGTLARDLRDFVDLGWQIESVQPLLLFPMTSHLETVVSLSKLS